MIADLKQFFEATLSQQLAQQKREIMEEIRGGMNGGFAGINQRFDEQSEKMDKIFNAIRADLAKHSATLEDHATRITRLERKVV